MRFVLHIALGRPLRKANSIRCVQLQTIKLEYANAGIRTYSLRGTKTYERTQCRTTAPAYSITSLEKHELELNIYVNYIPARHKFSKTELWTSLNCRTSTLSMLWARSYCTRTSIMYSRPQRQKYGSKKHCSELLYHATAAKNHNWLTKRVPQHTGRSAYGK